MWRTKVLEEEKKLGRGGREKGRSRSGGKMARERRTGEGMRAQKCVGGKRREEELTTEHGRSFPKRRCVPKPDD